MALRILCWHNSPECKGSSACSLLPWSGTHTDCTDQFVDLSIETSSLVPHLRQHISIPLSQVELAEDVAHYTRDPERPLQRKRLMLVINEKRPHIIS